jgi:hypothetical protein
MKSGIELITDERKRQIEVEGWTPEHDRQHTRGELALVAALYATPITLVNSHGDDPWPWWDEQSYEGHYGPVPMKIPAWDKRKKHSQLRKLVIAGALIAAEIDRLQSIGG